MYSSFLPREKSPSSHSFTSSRSPPRLLNSRRRLGHPNALLLVKDTFRTQWGLPASDHKGTGTEAPFTFPWQPRLSRVWCWMLKPRARPSSVPRPPEPGVCAVTDHRSGEAAGSPGGSERRLRTTSEQEQARLFSRGRGSAQELRVHTRAHSSITHARCVVK